MSNNAWFSCADADYAWKCSVTSQIAYPLSVRVSGGGETLTGYGVVTSANDGLVFDLGYNFGSNSGGDVDTDTDTDTDTDGGDRDEEDEDEDEDSNPPVVTPAPTSGSGGSGSYITVTSRASSSAWWYTCALSGVPAGITIESVRMKHANSLSWETGKYQSWSGGYYSFSETAPFTPPLSFKIKSTAGQTLTAMDLVPSYTAGSSGTMTQSFSSSFIYEDTNGEEESDWTLWFALAMVTLVMIGAVALVITRRRSGRSKVYFADSKDIEATELATNDMMMQDPVDTAKVVVPSMDDIEVEVEVDAQQPITR